MGTLSDFIGYTFGRNLSKGILVVSAVAISTFATTNKYLAEWLNFDLFGFPVKNYIALSLIIVGLLIRDYNVLSPTPLPFFRNKSISKYCYYVGLGVVAVAISSISFPLLDNLLNTTILDFSWLAIRNIVAAVLLLSARAIHVSG